MRVCLSVRACLSVCLSVSVCAGVVLYPPRLLLPPSTAASRAGADSSTRLAPYTSTWSARGTHGLRQPFPARVPMYVYTQVHNKVLQLLVDKGASIDNANKDRLTARL